MSEGRAVGPDEATALVATVFEQDTVAHGLGLEWTVHAPGDVEVRLRPEPVMTNGHGLVHGGYVFLVADTCVAYVCQSVGVPSVTRQAEIVYLAPARAGTVLRARGTVRARHGRHTIVDVAVRTTEGDLVAEFRGHGTQLRSGG